ncbi:hypothetical protein KPK_A0096 (plasmid) [Klebsiella variicola]|uniref:Uncharacterized protein n=1 Tax=Klebsiella variicola (strain 342) TaxID=507522 RepID=B5RK21_KLEV3|nr:hypothetical protein KPK_A0096 [Klebsiella variicola]
MPPYRTEGRIQLLVGADLCKSGKAVAATRHKTKRLPDKGSGHRRPRI